HSVRPRRDAHLPMGVEGSLAEGRSGAQARAHTGFPELHRRGDRTGPGRQTSAPRSTASSLTVAVPNRNHFRRRMTAEISAMSTPTGNGSTNVKAALTNGFA